MNLKNIGIIPTNENYVHSLYVSSGVIAFPTALVNKDENILKCTPCGSEYCVSDLEDVTSTNDTAYQMISSDLNDSSAISELIDIEWVNAYCLIHDLGIEVQYFPFFLLLLPLCLCLVQKIASM